jgi:hypothetical protein
MDCRNLSGSSIDSAIFSKIRERLYAPHHMPAPAFARRRHFPIRRAILIQKADRQLSGKLTTKMLQFGELDEMIPDCPVSIARSPWVPQPLDLPQRSGHKTVQGHAS